MKLTQNLTAIFTTAVVTLLGIAPAIAQYVPPNNGGPKKTTGSSTRVVDTPPSPEHRGSGR